MTAALADFEGRALDLDAAKEAFDRDGFLIIPGALSPAQVKKADQAFRDLLADHPEDFARFSESFITAPDILTRTEAFDHLIETPMVLELLGKLIGPRLSIEELSLILREPTDNVGELKGWHRDIIRAYERRFEIDPISVVYYLTDVGPSDHCFSIVPGTHAARVDMRPEDVTPGMEFDALGPAGSAFVFHARCIHGGKLKLGSKARRTVHLYYGSTDKPRTSEWTRFPDRLANRQAPGVPPTLYAKTRRTDVIDGVGRRPRDIPQGLSTAEQLIRVQRAANRKPGAM